MWKVLNKKLHGTPKGAVDVSRSGPNPELGNPFTHLDIGRTRAKVQVRTIEEAVRCFELWEQASNESETLDRCAAAQELKEICGLDWARIVDRCGWAPSRARIRGLKGKDLVCWCVDRDGKGPCHGHTLVKIANA